MPSCCFGGDADSTHRRRAAPIAAYDAPTALEKTILIDGIGAMGVCAAAMTASVAKLMSDSVPVPNLRQHAGGIPFGQRFWA